MSDGYAISIERTGGRLARRTAAVPFAGGDRTVGRVVVRADELDRLIGILEEARRQLSARPPEAL